MLSLDVNIVLIDINLVCSDGSPPQTNPDCRSFRLRALTIHQHVLFARTASAFDTPESAICKTMVAETVLEWRGGAKVSIRKIQCCALDPACFASGSSIEDRLEDGLSITVNHNTPWKAKLLPKID